MDNIPSAFSFALFSKRIKIVNSILNKEKGVKAKKSCSTSQFLIFSWLTLRPPVSWTTGIVPYLIAYNWFSPQGSNADGINNISQLKNQEYIQKHIDVDSVWKFLMTSNFRIKDS